MEKDIVERDRAILDRIGIPVLPLPAAEIYLALVTQPDAHFFEGSRVEKRIVINLPAFCRGMTIDHLKRHPEISFSAIELANLCECHLRSVGLVKRWEDSSAFGGPMEPLDLAALEREVLYRVFAVEDFKIGTEVTKVGKKRITEDEIEKGLAALRKVHESGMLDSSNRSEIEAEVTKQTGFQSNRVTTIMDKLIQRGRLINEGGARIARWRYVEAAKDQPTAEDEGGPIDVLTLRARLQQRKSDIELKIAVSEEELAKQRKELERCSIADEVIQSLLE